MLFGEECDCHCHDGDFDVAHIMPCCYECPTCHTNIDVVNYETHEKRCGEEYKELLSSVLGKK
jgi:hypothetical protein